jgi:hypothetical protein
MTDSKPLLSQTAQTASFAFREYFQPLVGVDHFLKSRLPPAKPAPCPAEDQASLEVGREKEKSCRM